MRLNAPYFTSGLLSNTSNSVSHGFLTKIIDLEILGQALGKDFCLMSMNQVHGSNIEIVDGKVLRYNSGFFGVIQFSDGLITAHKKVALVVKTADCVPILVYDPERNVVGVLHAGWRGTLGGILLGIVESMKEAFGSNPLDILVAIGPSIGPCCYEVKDDVSSLFIKGGLATCILNRNGKMYLDIPDAGRVLFEKAGVLPNHIDCIKVCSRCLPNLFHSYRRERGKNEVQYSFIAMC